MIDSRLLADTLTRADVRVSRIGWVEDKRPGLGGSIVGLVTRDVASHGAVIWRASSGDIQAWAHKRNDAIATVIDLYNLQEKARSYDLLARFAERVA